MTDTVLPDLIRIINTALIGVVAFILKSAYADLQRLRERVDQHGEKLANHGARIESVENDVRFIRGGGGR